MAAGSVRGPKRTGRDASETRASLTVFDISAGSARSTNHNPLGHYGFLRGCSTAVFVTRAKTQKLLSGPVGNQVQTPTEELYRRFTDVARVTVNKSKYPKDPKNFSSRTRERESVLIGGHCKNFVMRGTR